MQDRQADRKQRYPAKGLHWLLGLVRLASGDTRRGPGRVRAGDCVRDVAAHGREFAMNAYDGAGFAHLDAKEQAPPLKRSTRRSSSS